jgi:Arc/MetJ-type ribon-helix-helix transcriptional regulator
MPRFTVTVTDEQAALLEDLSSDGGPYESKSEAVRSFIQDGERLAELEQENDRLQRERRQLLEQREEHQELARYAEDQRENEQRVRERRQQPAWVRAWWWLTGEPG